MIRPVFRYLICVHCFLPLILSERHKKGKITTAVQIRPARVGCIASRRSHSSPTDRIQRGARGFLPVRKSNAPPTPITRRIEPGSDRNDSRNPSCSGAPKLQSTTEARRILSDSVSEPGSISAPSTRRFGYDAMTAARTSSYVERPSFFVARNMGVPDCSATDRMKRIRSAPGYRETPWLYMSPAKTTPDPSAMRMSAADRQPLKSGSSCASTKNSGLTVAILVNGPPVTEEVTIRSSSSCERLSIRMPSISLRSLSLILTFLWQNQKHSCALMPVYSRSYVIRTLFLVH